MDHLSSDTIDRQSLVELLSHIDQERPAGCETWERWEITPSPYGSNNAVYRARTTGEDLCLKFTIPDKRRRAYREYHALVTLAEACPGIAPQPLLLDESSFSLPVVVTTWLEGSVSKSPPADDEEWRALLGHMSTVHRVRPAAGNMSLLPQLVNAYSIREGKEIVREQIVQLPQEAIERPHQTLLDRFYSTDLAEWAGRTVSLCRGDSNTLNLIRRDGDWASVDWEHSGWGDPAFDIANLITHPAYIGMEDLNWEELVRNHYDFGEDQSFPVRLTSYYQILLVWWVARFARYLHEVPRGLDARLKSWSSDSVGQLRSQYDLYLAKAEAVYR